MADMKHKNVKRTRSVRLPGGAQHFHRVERQRGKSRDVRRWRSCWIYRKAGRETERGQSTEIGYRMDRKTLMSPVGGGDRGCTIQRHLTRILREHVYARSKEAGLRMNIEK